MSEKAAIQRLATGVPGLDAVLGGGIPELSFNLIAGPVGSGKTTLAHQLMFALATKERRALYFTVLGEPPLKMLRYQQQFAFFEPKKVNDLVRFVNLNEEVTSGNFELVLARIRKEVAASSPGLVFFDSFRSILLQNAKDPCGPTGPQRFLQQLGALLSGWEATTFLVGEYAEGDDEAPIFAVADGLILLNQEVSRNSTVRKLQVLKMRGQANRTGKHTFQISSAGLQIFPTALVPDDASASAVAASAHRSEVRLSMGVPGLDELLGGGLPTGYSLLVAGPSGSGKTVLATSFLVEGVRLGQPGVMVAFEQTPSQSLTRTIDDLVRNGQIGLINSRALDLSIDEVLYRLLQEIREKKAVRVVIDSLSGFELAVAPSFREDFRESLFRMVGVLAGLGVTVLMTSELEDRYTDLRFSPNGSAFLTDAIIVQRYIEIDSTLRRVMGAVKMRGSNHSKQLRQYDITGAGIVIGTTVEGYDGLLSGSPTRIPAASV